MSTGIPKLEYLPGVKVLKNDGNLAPESLDSTKGILIIGTASSGPGETPYYVRSTHLARTTFSTDGTLVRGLYEVKKAGAKDVILFRIGATSAIVSGIGGQATLGTGYTIETSDQDDTAGAAYSVYYDDTTDRLVVYNTEDDSVVYDNDKTAPINTFDVTVSGYRATGSWDDIGTASTPVVLEDIIDLTPATSDYSYTAGTDGLNLSRMEMYEKLYRAYKLLAEYEFDICIPMDVYMDDLNLTDEGNGSDRPYSDNGANSYPDYGDNTPGTSVDSLGLAYMEEYQGVYYWWWKFQTVAGAGNATADIFPAGIGSASATTKIDGTAITSADWHQVNFAHQLGYFMFDYSTNNVDATGVIGVRPFNSPSLADMAAWLGEEPTYTVNNVTGAYTVDSASDNGSGLLGNRYMAGSYGYRSGVYGGGFIATTTEWLDGDEEATDDNDQPIDLGKFLSVVVDWPVLRNDYVAGGAGYIGTYAPSYAGMYYSLSPSSAPTNKSVVGVQLYYKIGVRKLDLLAKRGYVALREKPQGVVIADAPTASLPGSDYKRLSTIRIVKNVIDAVREVLDPFIGEGTSDAQRSAMHSAVDGVLLRAKKAGFLTAYREFEIYQTPDMRVAGKADVALTLVPAFELREINVSISLAKE